MAKREKLDREVRSLPASIRYTRLAEWLEDNGWSFERTARDNHRVWKLKGLDTLSIPLVNGTVKRTYIAQVIKITDQA